MSKVQCVPQFPTDGANKCSPIGVCCGGEVSLCLADLVLDPGILTSFATMRVWVTSFDARPYDKSVFMCVLPRLFSTRFD